MSKFSDGLYRLKQWWLKRIWWPLRGRWLDKQLAPGGMKRSEAEEQLARILYETGIRPDAVTATTMRGGPCFLVRHKAATEVFIHNSYTEAADKTIEWLKLQGNEITPKKLDAAPVMSRKTRRAYARKLRREKQH
jgi:hypothetical protein